MSELKLNTGTKEYNISDETSKPLGVLRCNPADPNIGVRFQELENAVASMASDYDALQARRKEDKKDYSDAEFWSGVQSVDANVKEKLAYTFGADNDFDQLFAGMHVMSLGTNGQPIIFNFLEMMEPVVTKGVNERVKLMGKKIQEAKSKQAANREQRRALAKK